MSNAPSGQDSHTHLLTLLIRVLRVLTYLLFLMIGLSAIPNSVISLSSEYLPELLSNALYFATGLCKALLSLIPSLEAIFQMIGNFAQKGADHIIDPNVYLSLYKCFPENAIGRAYAQLIIVLVVHVLGSWLIHRLFCWIVEVIWNSIVNLTKTIFLNIKHIATRQDPIEVRIQRQDEDFNKDDLPSGLKSGLTPQYLKEANVRHARLKQLSRVQSPEHCYLRIQYLNADDHPISEEIRDLSEGDVTIEPEIQGVNPIIIVQDWGRGAYIQLSGGGSIPLKHGEPRIIRRDNRGGAAIQHYALTLFGNG